MCSSRPKPPPQPEVKPAPPPSRLKSAVDPTAEDAGKRRGSRNPLRIDLTAPGANTGSGASNGLNII